MEFEILYNQEAFTKSKDISQASTFDEIIKYVNSNYKDDAEKLSMICGWFFYNFDYDIKNFITGETYSNPEVIFNRKKGICYDMCILFQAFCSELNVRCEIFEGYTKDLDGQFNLCETNHSWNAVYINDNWYHCDILWTIGELLVEEYKPQEFSFRKKVSYWNFLNRGDFSFLDDHIPAIPMWQLQSIVIEIEYFTNKTPNKQSTIIDFNAEIEEFYHLDELSKSLLLADKAHKYNNQNHNILTVNYYNAAVELFNSAKREKGNEGIKKAVSYLDIAKGNVEKSCNGVSELEINIDEAIKLMRQYAP